MLYGAIVLMNTSVPDCATTTATVIQFDYADYIPPMYYKWLNISYDYTVKNVSYIGNIFRSEITTSQYDLYAEDYYPVGRNITLAYLQSDPHQSP